MGTKKKKFKDVIEEWQVIVHEVFAAEHAIMDEWKERLNEAKTMELVEQSLVCRAYERAVAKELLSNRVLKVMQETMSDAEICEFLEQANKQIENENNK
jgi:hypothetical protein